jgi:hypothetical protein
VSFNSLICAGSSLNPQWSLTGGSFKIINYLVCIPISEFVFGPLCFCCCLVHSMVSPMLYAHAY